MLIDRERELRRGRHRRVEVQPFEGFRGEELVRGQHRAQTLALWRRPVQVLARGATGHLLPRLWRVVDHSLHVGRVEQAGLREQRDEVDLVPGFGRRDGDGRVVDDDRRRLAGLEVRDLPPVAEAPVSGVPQGRAAERVAHDRLVPPVLHHDLIVDEEERLQAPRERRVRFGGGEPRGVRP